jgi:hypothetical protein
VRFRTNLTVAALVAGLVGPTPAWAWTSPGCTNLPEYERALGALQGMTSACDMSIEKANRIVAAQGYRPGGLFGALSSGPTRPVADAVPSWERWLAAASGTPTVDRLGQNSFPCTSEAVAMDVILTPTGTAGDAWSLKDRLGRTLGEVTKPENSEAFVIMPEPEGALRTVKSMHASLDEAMSAIARIMNGACTLDSQDWVSRGSAPRSI